MNAFQIEERKQRENSYYNNLKKEERITKVFIQWCKDNHYRYRVNPTDTSANLLGSDITIQKSGIKYEVDLKGCQYKYNTVALSYQRSYDGHTWKDCLSSKTKITDLYVFIDELNNIYGITRDEILFRFNKYHKTNGSLENCGHYQKLILIPKDDLMTM